MRQLILIDDNATLVRVMGRSLAAFYEVKTFVHPRDAVRYMEENTAALDVIISDFKMPGLNGFEVLEMARTISPRSIRILLTGYADDAVFENKEAFCDVIMDKNICKSTQDIVDLIERITLQKRNNV